MEVSKSNNNNNNNNNNCNHVMLTNKMHFLNYCFNLILLVFYMFRTSYVHHQEDCIIFAVLICMFPMHLRKQSTRLKDVLDTPHEHKMFETCKTGEELN